MNHRIKSIIKKIVPELILCQLLSVFLKLKTIIAKKRFKRSPETPVWLE